MPDILRAWLLVLSAFLSSRKIIVFHFGLPSHIQNVGDIPLLLEREKKYLVIKSYEWEIDRLNQIKNYKNHKQDISKKSFYNPAGFVMATIPAHLSVVPACGKKIGYPFFAKKIHFFISMASFHGVYNRDMLTDYDFYFCAGKHQFEDLPNWLRKYDQRNGVAVPGGYPKLDVLLRKVSCVESSSQQVKLSDMQIIIYAPTHVYKVNENSASVRKYGSEIVKNSSKKHKLIFRPHPVSFYDEDSDLIEAIIKANSSNVNFNLDSSENYFNSYSSSDLMITDLSGTGFTYAFAFEKPVIFIDRGIKGKGIQFEQRDKIGMVCNNIENLDDTINDVLENYDELVKNISIYRETLLYNIGNSEKYFVANIENIISSKYSNDWTDIKTL